MAVTTEFMYRNEPLRFLIRDEYMSEVASQLYNSEGGYVNEIFYNFSKDEFRVKYTTAQKDVYIRLTQEFFEQLEEEDDDSEEYLGVFTDVDDSDASFTSVYKFEGEL